MLGSSWQEDPAKLWRYRLSKMLIDDTRTYDGITVRRMTVARFQVAYAGKVFVTKARNYADALEGALTHILTTIEGGGMCKVCGKPRRVGSAYRFCQEHMREYWRRRRAIERRRILKPPRNKVNPQIVREIRSLRRSGMTYGDLARRYGLDETSIGRIVKRQTWRDVA